MDNTRIVSYTENEKEIVRKGIPAIQDILMGNDSDKKRSLLLCLDWFMDPYYGQDISQIYDELVLLLQKVAISPNEKDVVDDVLNLLSSYAWPPFEILEQNLPKIPAELKPDALYVINMDKEN